MKNLIINLCSFLLILTIVITSILTVNYLSINYTKIIDTKTEILFLGDSNMECAINDSVILKSKNLGKSAESYYYSYLKLKKILESENSINKVFLSFSPHNIYENGWFLNESNLQTGIGKYYPFMDNSDFNFVLSKKPKAVLTSLPRILSRVKDNLIRFVVRKPISYGGYIDLHRNILGEVKAKLKNDEELPFFKIPENHEISNEEIIYLKKIEQLCYKKNVNLYLINLPKRKEILNYKKYGIDNYYEYYLSNLKEIPLIDLSHIEMPDDYYGDFVHLSSKGSHCFSNFLQKNGLKSILNDFAKKTRVRKVICF